MNVLLMLASITALYSAGFLAGTHVSIAASIVLGALGGITVGANWKRAA